MARRLKVFRTPIGFHDAYVAAPGRAAALRAWGAERDLFARGAAEEVTDPALTAAPLAAPGTVVKLSRGTAAEQLAALPPASRRHRPAPSPEPDRPPEPDRTDLDAAAQALAGVEARAARATRDFDEREAALARERRAAERTVADERRRAERTRDRAVRAYDEALARWRDR